jgi:tetraprenyl-beta-curcumene synthase
LASGPNPASLTARQLHALGKGAVRELGWGLRAVRQEVAYWRARANAIPDPVMRRQALEALADKRPLLDGAALFWILPNRRNPELLRLLVAFQALANYHDHASEQAAGGAGGPGSAMSALVEAVDVDRPLTGYGEGAGTSAYLRALAGTCRRGCVTLPNYRSARPLLIRQVHRARSLDLEHDPEPVRRAGGLTRFAAAEFGPRADATWWELTAGAASLLTAIVVLALAADEQTSHEDLEHAVSAYTWVASTSAFLDNYVDRFDDLANGRHNYLAYYSTPDDAMRGMTRLIERSIREAGALLHGDRHVVIVASMAALYLSSGDARAGGSRSDTQRLVASGGRSSDCCCRSCAAGGSCIGSPSRASPASALRCSTLMSNALVQLGNGS